MLPLLELRPGRSVIRYRAAARRRGRVSSLLLSLSQRQPQHDNYDREFRYLLRTPRARSAGPALREPAPGSEVRRAALPRRDGSVSLVPGALRVTSAIFGVRSAAGLARRLHAAWPDLRTIHETARKLGETPTVTRPSERRIEHEPKGKRRPMSLAEWVGRSQALRLLGRRVHDLHDGHQCELATLDRRRSVHHLG